jgi:UrcA family protein
MNRQILLIAAMLAGAAATPAIAQDVVRVTYRPADLASASGRAAITRQIDRAATRVCDEVRTPNSRIRDRAWSDCRTGAIAAAQAQLDRAIANANRTSEVASLGR